MSQPILKRRLNPLLLISTVAALALLAGVSVIAQDQIAKAQQNVSQTAEELKEAEDRIQELSLDNKNMSVRLNSLNHSLTETESELEQARQELENKTEEVENLQNQLDSQEGFNELGSDQSTTVEDINSSLEVVCTFGSPFGGEDADLARTECLNWGHEVN